MRISILILINLVLLAHASCQQEPHNRPHCQDPAFDKEVNSWLNYSVPVIGVKRLAGQKDSFLVLDAREREEFMVSRIPGALYLGYDNPDWGLLKGVKEDTPIVVYCSIGYRSEKIGKSLADKGYTQVYNLYGSIFEWANRGNPLETPEGEITDTIHTYNKKWSRWVLNPDLIKTW